MRHRGDLHRGLEPGPPCPAALRNPGRGNPNPYPYPYPYDFGSVGRQLFSVPSALLLASPQMISLSFLI